MRQSSSGKTTKFSVREKLYTQIPRSREERKERIFLWQEVNGQGREACRTTHHSPLTSSATSLSSCSASWTQDKLTLSSDSPSGTLGGRMPGTKKPAPRSLAAARRVLSGEPSMTGTIWLSERPM